MPESITVKGNPGLYVPLGSPFAGMKPEDRLENLISPDNIRKMMNGNGEAGLFDDLKIYEVDEDLTAALGIDREVQTYLVRYPLAEMPLDLGEYVKDAMDAVNAEKQLSIPYVPDGGVMYLTEDGPTGTETNKPFIKIPLADMAKLVKWVERSDPGIFGLEINYSPELALSLELKIPGLGFDWIHGIPTDDDGNSSTSPTKLRYYNPTPTKTKFYPRKDGTTPSDLDKDGNLLVYARISGASQKQTLTPSLIFEWKKALINTDGTDGKSSFSGEYPMNNNLSEFLGNGVSFKRVDGYMYMSGVTGSGSMSIGIYNASDVSLDNKTPSLHSVDAPNFPVKGKFTNKDILDHQSLNKPLDMKTLLNNPDSARLKVSITIDNMEIDSSDAEKHIQFDLLLLIPLDLEVSNEITDTAVGSNIRSNYVMLDLVDSLNNSAEGDLFGRNEDDEENFLNNITYVKIGISKPNINIIDSSRLAVLVTTTEDNSLLELRDNASLQFTGAVLNKIPFSPKFSVLLRKDGGSTTGSFKILRPKNPSFDFKLYVEAKTAFEYTVDF